jgi:hypothetical protein
MQRPQWCMDDYEIGDKLYTGYASIGALQLAAAADTLAGQLAAVGVVWGAAWRGVVSPPPRSTQLQRRQAASCHPRAR